MSQLFLVVRKRAIVHLVLVATVLVQLALLTHAITFDHQAGERCEICLAQDRVGAGLAGTWSFLAPLLLAIAFLLPASPAQLDTRRPAAVRSRGPPRL